MFEHIGLRVKNLQAPAHLYAQMLSPLGHVPGTKGDGYAGFGAACEPALRLRACSARCGEPWRGRCVPRCGAQG